MRRYDALIIAALVACVAPLAAQGKGPKKYAVTTDRALVVTREVLVKQGYEVVRVENSGRDVVVLVSPRQQGERQGEGPPGEDGDPPDRRSRGIPERTERSAGRYRRAPEVVGGFNMTRQCR